MWIYHNTIVTSMHLAVRSLWEYLLWLPIEVAGDKTQQKEEE